ncbi:PIN domain-containing protein [Roseofilum casamattae]|uniref:PIN domain-containing protein n=1 Tax=Roseofilum casamattae BLCC-M143 TaxID=3022442 RepID=A0ABT7BR18_9CYAN|nr:PIN domain-containing protein [Roseofilum casamattae]MDJ1181616.1 PIN domain-containing protein [Roseofilum casamattae BLCC-M143]
MKRILFDSDVIIDVMMQRQPFVFHSASALSTATNPDIEAYVAAHAVTNIFYIVRRQLGIAKTLEILDRLLQNLNVATVNHGIIRSALESTMTDFEDAVTSEAARVTGVELIVTRNINDYASSPVPAVLPEIFLTML